MERIQKIISETYDKKSCKLIKRTVIKERTIIDPKKIDDIGYTQKEQVELLQNVQDEYLEEMVHVMTENKDCPKCGNKTYRCGSLESEFNSIYTDHKIKMSGLKCSNKECDWEYRKTIYGEYGSKMHPDLVKIQVEKASIKSYSASQAELDRECGKVRRVNSNLSIKNTVDKVGQILNKLHTNYSSVKVREEAEELVIQVDGGYIKDKNPKINSFETLLVQVYNPKNHNHGYKKPNGTRVSGEIINKTCVASSLKDRGQTIKKMVLFAAKKQGITAKTKVTALCDGAENCWNAAKTISVLCNNQVTYVLDWYHIKQKFESLANKVEDPYLSKLESIKWKIWHGESEEAITRLLSVYEVTSKYDYTDKIHELYKYLANNKEYLVNYVERKEQQLPYSSSIIESAIESIINERHKKKQKAQWSREGAHNVLQIRTSRVSNDWDNEWNTVKDKFYVSRYNKELKNAA